MLNFKLMLKRYEQPLTIVNKAPGQYNNSGQWVPGASQNVETRCAVVPMSNSELEAAEGGKYTQNDRKLYIHQKLEEGQTVITDGKTYKVDAEKDYSYHASGLRLYIIVKRGVAGD